VQLKKELFAFTNVNINDCGIYVHLGYIIFIAQSQLMDVASLIKELSGHCLPVINYSHCIKAEFFAQEMIMLKKFLLT
jgi:hypothetical protein